MTAKQIQDFNAMLFTLKRIAKVYESTAKIRKQAEGEYGLDYEEVLEMAYENIQHEARRTAHGIRKIITQKK